MKRGCLKVGNKSCPSGVLQLAILRHSARGGHVDISARYYKLLHAKCC
jgi:hypothetical protein